MYVRKIHAIVHQMWSTKLPPSLLHRRQLNLLTIDLMYCTVPVHGIHAYNNYMEHLLVPAPNVYCTGCGITVIQISLQHSKNHAHRYESDQTAHGTVVYINSLF